MEKIYLVCAVTSRDALEPAKAFRSKEKADNLALEAERHKDAEPNWLTPEWPTFSPEFEAAREVWKARAPLPKVEDSHYGFVVVEIELE